MNKMRLKGHQGPHPEYDRIVYERLRAKTDGLTGEAYNEAFDAELEAIRIETETPGSKLNKLATGQGGTP